MYIKQFMGHKRIESTAAYFQSLNDVEKVVKLREIDQKKENKKRHTKTLLKKNNT